jgi:Helix-turn-helix domain
MAVSIPEPSSRPAFTPTEAAAQADCTTTWLAELCRRGQGPPSYKRHGRRFFPQAEFLAWLREHKRAHA